MINNYKILVSLLLIFFFITSPIISNAGGGGSGGIIAVVVGVILDCLTLGTDGGFFTMLGLELSTTMVVALKIAATIDLALTAGTGQGIFANVFQVATGASLFGGTAQTTQGTFTPVSISQTGLPAQSGVGIMGACPEGSYNSQNQICVPVGRQSCLDFGIKGACPTGYSCSASYGGSCWPGRAQQPPVTIDFSVDKPEPSINEVVTFDWISTGATSCVMNQDVGGLYATGTIPIVFSKTGIWDWVIRCAGEGGEQKKVITIDIPQVIVNLNTDRTLTAIKDRFTLTWSSQNAKACSLDNNIGAVPLSGNKFFHFDSTGDKNISFICNGRGGVSTSTVNITAVTKADYDAQMLSKTTATSEIAPGSSIFSRLINATSEILDSARQSATSVLNKALSLLNIGAPPSTSIETGIESKTCPTLSQIFCPTGQHSVSGPIDSNGCLGAPHCAADTSTLISTGTTTGTSSPFIQQNTKQTAKLILSGGSNGSVLTEDFIPADIVHVPFGAATNIQLNPVVRDGSSPGPKALNPGEPLQLDWSFASSTECIVSNDADSEILQIPPVGSAIVHPSHTATYHISCQGGTSGPILNSKTIFVKTVPGFTEVPPQ